MALPVRQQNREITPWDPFRELAQLDARMNRLFESAFSSAPTHWSPPVDVEETDTAYVIEADLPGVKKDDISIELTNNVLSIHGETKERERVGILRHKTRRTGEFDYRMTMPSDVDADNVTGTLDEGVLRVEVAKTEAAQSKQITIS